MPLALHINANTPNRRWIRHAKTTGLTLAGGGKSITLWAIFMVKAWSSDVCLISSSVGNPITKCNYWFGLENGLLTFKIQTEGAALEEYQADLVVPSTYRQGNAAHWYQKYNIAAVCFTDGNDPEFYVGLMGSQIFQTELDPITAPHGIGGTRMYYQSGTWVTGGGEAHVMADDGSSYVYVLRDSSVDRYFSDTSQDRAMGNFVGYGIINEHVFDYTNPIGTELMGVVEHPYFELPRFIEDIDAWATNRLPAPGEYPQTWDVGGLKSDDATYHDGEVIGFGDGAETNFTRTLDHILVEKNSLTITTVSSNLTVTDDGNGNLTGDVDGGGTNTIDYETGEIDVTFIWPPNDEEDVVARYTFHGNHQLFVLFEHQSNDWEYAIRNHVASDIFDATDAGHGTSMLDDTPAEVGTYPSAWHLRSHESNLHFIEGGGDLRRELPQERVPADIQGHTTQHYDLHGLSKEYLLDIYEKLDGIFRSYGLSAPLHTAYPNGAYDANTKLWTAERRLSARTASALAGAGAGGINRYPISTDPTDTTDGSGSCWFELACWQCHQRDTHLADAKGYIDLMSGTLGLYILYTHGTQRFPDNNFHTDPSLQRELIQYALDAGVHVVDMIDAYRLIEQEGGGTFTESLLVFTYDDEYPGSLQYTYRYLARLLGVGGTHYISDAAMRSDNWEPMRRSTYDDICATAGLPISYFVVRFIHNGVGKTGLFPRAISPDDVEGTNTGYMRVVTNYGDYNSAPLQGFVELANGYYAMPVCGGLGRTIRVHSMNFEMADAEVEIVGMIPTTITQRGFLTRELREEIEQAVRIRVSQIENKIDVVDATVVTALLETAIDGSLTFLNVMTSIASMTRGVIARNGDVYQLKNQAGTTLFTWTITPTGRAIS